MEPVILALERKYGDKIDFIIAHVDKERSLVERFQVNTIPAFFIIDSNGAVSDTGVGSLSEQDLESKIRRVIK